MFKGMMSFFSPAFSPSTRRCACQMLSQYHWKIAFSHKVSIWKPISNASPCPCYCWPERADTGKKGVWSHSGFISSVCPEENYKWSETTLYFKVQFKRYLITCTWMWKDVCFSVLTLWRPGDLFRVDHACHPVTAGICFIPLQPRIG